MAAVDIGVRHNPPVTTADDLDDLFSYDVFRDVDTNMDVPGQQKPAIAVDGKENMPGLGIDEEIKVTKRRTPVPKLDENRLLGPAGIPKLRRITKERLKLKGKGHEYSDLARLLNVYQLWLDELYPRAKFADGLAIIEKLGHSKRMQTMRREWIDGGKAKESMESEDFALHNEPSRLPNVDRPRSQRTIADLTTKSHADATFIEDRETGLTPSSPREGRIPDSVAFPSQSLFVSDDEGEPPEDDLDALLVEDQTKRASMMVSTPQEPSGRSREEDFEDEMEVMAEMDSVW